MANMLQMQLPVIVLSSMMVLNSRAQDLNLYYGLLHGHTAFSDGSGTPEQAYKKARTNGLDFFAVTEHNHAAAESGADERRDGVLIATRPELYNGTAMLDLPSHFNGTRMASVRARSVIGAAGATTNTSFTALYGQEFSTISKGNHMNVFGIDQVLTNPNGDFSSLLATLAAIRGAGNPPPVIQLNHPDVQADLFYGGSDQTRLAAMCDDYGVDDLGPHFRDWVAAMDDYISLVEVLSGPAMDSREHATFHYRDNHERDYYVYLTQGLHVSPSAGQDNHYTNWGTATPARTGVYARSCSAADVLQAFRENRTFATEDRNLSVKFWVNDHFMGDRITATMDQPLQVRCEVKDADEPNAHYRITLVSGTVDPRPATEVEATGPADGVVQVLEDVTQGGHAFDALVVAVPESFFYITVEQTDEDKAWSAPVWVSVADGAPVATTTGAASFCWSTGRSSVYHKPECSSVRTIKPENLECGTTPPADRQQHSCPIPNEAVDH